MNASTIFRPETDGIDHINIYSRGRTELGRQLSNFYPSEIAKPYGVFGSIEALYHYLKAMRSIGVDSYRLADVPSQFSWVIKTLEGIRSTYGVTAKQYGKRLRTDLIAYGVTYLDVPDDAFNEEIIEATVQKINTSKALKQMVIDNDLPMAHYYVKDCGQPIYTPHLPWTANIVAEAISRLHDESFY